MAQDRATPGCFSVIAKKLVDADATGKAGTVTGDNVWARAGGELCSWNNVQQFYQVHREAQQGRQGRDPRQRRRLLQDHAPQGLRLLDQLQAGGPRGQDASRDGRVRPRHGRGGARRQQRPRDRRNPRRAGGTTQPAIDPNSPAGQFKTVEQELFAEYKKPADQQDLDALLRKYQAIDVGNDAYVKRAIDSRVKFIQEQLRLGQ